MSGEAERVSHPASLAFCPGLDGEVSWDEPAYLKGELYHAEQLAQHARELARAHDKPLTQRTPGPLRRRFSRAKQRIAEAYQVLAADAKTRREPSPAEEWLLDNASVVQEQIREIAEDLPFGYLVELPRLRRGPMRGYPRVYALCIDYLRHTDARVDAQTLASFVSAYQSEARLTIGELWAVPIMLRLGLILTVGALAASEAAARDRDRGDSCAELLLANGASSSEIAARLHELEKQKDTLSATFLVQLLKRLREHEGSVDRVRDWAHEQALRMGTTPDELVRREHLRQAADQVSVGNAITSMRAVTAMDWADFFERTSAVEEVLRQDPGGAYAASDQATRDRYRHAVEDLARRGKLDELGVARAALELALAHENTGGARAHVGYYFVDSGRPELERRVSYRPRLPMRVVRAILAHPQAFYFGLLALFTCVIVAGALASADMRGYWPWLLCAAFALPATEIALALVNGLTVSLIPPRLLAKLDFEQGIPDEHRTLVVVPVLIDTVEAVDQLIADLEVRSLANSDRNLYFGLLTDFPDASTETTETDAVLLERTRAGLAGLNARYGRGESRYWLFHRRRVHSAGERRYMGLERKRGKLEELNRLLRGDGETTFQLVTAPRELLGTIRYVITLDADTELPRDTGRKLVGTLAHPLNRPEVDLKAQRVTRGYGIVQPRVGTLPHSSRRTRFAAIMAGPSGIDPYTTAVSDTYQDLFGEGSFVGKGIYDVRAFSAALAGRVPPNQLLSHDLFEGLYARSALATDIEVLDEQPVSYAVQIGRQHRWVRGDWQLLPWLFWKVPALGGRRPNDLRAIDRWKIIDNLRRSLLAPSLVVMLASSWFLSPRVMAAALALLAGVLIVPLCARLLLSLLRQTRSTSSAVVGSVGGDLVANAPQVLLELVFALDRAWVSLDALARSTYRQWVSRSGLLEWTTMQKAQAAAGGVPARMWLQSAACLALLLGLAVGAPGALPFAFPLLLAWGAAPMLARWLGRPAKVRAPSFGIREADRDLLRDTARKTWRFFEEFVTDEENHLPPDNFQEDPRGVVAHRTSPTNMGLYLLSVVAARDLYYVCLRRAVDRLEQSIATLELLEKREGHILNWYDTITLRPLEPQYVSTVDSGNLAAYLWTLREACTDLRNAPIADERVIIAARDAVRLARRALEQDPDAAATVSELDALAERLSGVVTNARAPEGAMDALREAARAVAACRDALSVAELPSEVTYWLEQAELTLGRAIEEHVRLIPELGAPPEGLARASGAAELWQRLATRLAEAKSPAAVVAAHADALRLLGELQAALGSLPSGEREIAGRALLAVQENVARCALAGRDLLRRLEDIGRRASALADGMNFKFLFDEQRELFAIGYNVSSARLDGSHYDLLASEARLASLFCIAKGDIPQTHWFRMGRPRARVSGGRALCSWSGSMFEYLMPLLVMRNNPRTLLEEGYEVAIERQRRYGAERGVPWGVSESAYNVMDLRMTYQYRAFGVPGLGLKSGLGEDLVVAPYATVLAGLVRPELVAENLRALAKEGLEGQYGFYESIDYTPEHVPPGRKGVVVKAFMAHHQGMTLVALDNILNGAPMPERFHRDARIKATELLLEERVPSHAPEATLSSNVVPAPARAEAKPEVAEHVGLRGVGPMRAHLLGHGELSSLLCASGAGVTTWKGLDVNRFREDPLIEAGGIYFYLKNKNDGRVWSSGYLPTRAEPSFYNVAFSIDRVEYHRRDGDVQTVTEVILSPEHAVELRRITLGNHADEPVQIEVTTYSEVVLAPRGADVAHRAFGSLFVETEALPERSAILARRRPRLIGEPEVWLVQFLLPDSGNWSPLDFECSRARFVGRGNGTDAPRALIEDRGLSRQTGYVLDPALALRRSILIAPQSSARLTLVTGMAATRDEALALIETFSDQQSLVRANELNWAGVRMELRHLGISATEVHRFQRLLSAVIFPDPALRGVRPFPSDTTRGRTGLWAHGISGDLPIVLCRIDHSDFSDLCRDLVLAHEFWRLNGFVSDLVFINEEPSGYLQPTQDGIRDLIRHAAIDQRGGVFLRRADQMSEEERELITSAARVVLAASQGPLARQLRRAATLARTLPPPLVVAQGGPPPAAGRVRPRPELAFDNGFGGFADDGRTYVIAPPPGERTPAPWCNVMANPEFGTLVSEVGSSFTWFKNSQRNRLTPWSNDAVSDPSGELFYLRDDRTGSHWSLTPEPAGAGARYEARHGQGYTEFVHERGALRQELTIFVSPTDPVKCVRLRIDNRGARTERMSVFGFVEWVLGSSRETTRVSISSKHDAELRALFAHNPLGIFPSHRAFFCATAEVQSITADREEFLGVSGSRRAPEALGRTELSGRVGAGLDPCAALHVAFTVEAGKSIELGFALGEGESIDQARELAARFGDMQHLTKELERARATWDAMLGAVTISTPDRALDLLANRWLLYQSISSRVWGRTGFYQSSGAYGFRDQLQDVLATIHVRPSFAREHILRCAARQFAEGDVQHWWHAETGEGLRTKCSDDMLWLPYVTAEYVRATGDKALLDEAVPFLTDRLLAEGEEDLFSAPAASVERASLYEHCVRALQAGTTTGPHGIPKMGAGDWNDGMNRVGHHGQGESVWLAWFLARTLQDFSALALARGDRERVAWCNREVSRLSRAVEQHAWDGNWYRRAYFDDGSALGSQENKECCIDAIAQSWAVISGVAQPDRAAQAIRASEARLVSEKHRLMRLLTPPFERTVPDPGYIQAYPPGIRENGGQYTHGVLWSVLALTLLGEGDRAGALLSLLNPISHAADRQSAISYAVEPYVVAADIYSSEEHMGRGGWTWYTGSAGWFYRIVIENIVGLRRRGQALTITPCVPSAWSEFEVMYRYGATTYRISVENPMRVSHGVVRLEVDGSLATDGQVHLVKDGRTHEVRVTLGKVERAVTDRPRPMERLGT